MLSKWAFNLKNLPHFRTYYYSLLDNFFNVLFKKSENLWIISNVVSVGVSHCISYSNSIFDRRCMESGTPTSKCNIISILSLLSMLTYVCFVRFVCFSSFVLCIYLLVRSRDSLCYALSMWTWAQKVRNAWREILFCNLDTKKCWWLEKIICDVSHSTNVLTLFPISQFSWNVLENNDRRCTSLNFTNIIVQIRAAKGIISRWIPSSHNRIDRS